MNGMVDEKYTYINYNNCLRIVKVLNDYFKDREKLADVEFPSSILFGTNEYFLYMFYSCLLDYGMRSKIYHKNLINTYKSYPNIFNPKYVLSVQEAELKEIIVNNVHPRYPNIAVKKWVKLSQKLIKYDGILNHLKSINSFEELSYFIKDLKEYGQKTGGLLIRIICDSKVCNFEENIDSIPIDRHDIEISYLTRIINHPTLSDKNIKLLSDAYVRCGKELDINPSDIDKYLWEVGNSFCNKKKCSECLLKNCCGKGKIDN